jgi:hypothetical protein
VVPEYLPADGETEVTPVFPKPGPSPPAGVSVPKRLGRYLILSTLGKGSYGTVYLAEDESLGRRVAIKVPRPDRISKPSDIESYESEARLVATLDHPGIVPVYDVGHTEGGLCFVVSKYVEGPNLADVLKKRCPSYVETARLTFQIANALYYAHSHDVVHRDVKPANILIDEKNNAFLADFGVALKEEDFGKGARYAGTPAYMSPEQARGEGHRVDGRSGSFIRWHVSRNAATSSHQSALSKSAARKKHVSSSNIG